MPSDNVQIDSKSLVLCMIGLSGSSIEGELGGITRLQKLLFLLDKEVGVKADGNGFSFEAYKAGPYSSKLYDDLEFLENLGFLKSEEVGESSSAEAVELDALNFNDLIGGPSEDEPGGSDTYIERSFSLTSKGKEKIESLLENDNYKPFFDGIRKIKSKYGNYSLSDLLYYVYSKYPEMTTNSEIKDKVLRRGR